MEIIDRKFKFTAVNPCNGKIYTEENAFIICAKDAAALDALDAYEKRCHVLGAGDSHIESIRLLAERVKAFQDEHGYRIPDTEGECEIDRCIGGKGL